MSLSLARLSHHGLDDLRQFASDLATGLGVAPSRASAFATHLLWFDAVGASSHGISSLPVWLDRMERGEIHPKSEGRASSERAGTGLFDAQNGLPQLALETASRIASEKARDVGIGFVRIKNLPMSGPAAPAAAGLAIGPFIAFIGGPGASIAIACPMPEGLPFVYDSTLGDPTNDVASVPAGTWTPWISAVADADGWAILALSVAAFEPLTHFHERVSSTFRGSEVQPGMLGPDSWETRRRKSRDEGRSP